MIRLLRALRRRLLASPRSADNLRAFARSLDATQPALANELRGFALHLDSIPSPHDDR